VRLLTDPVLRRRIGHLVSRGAGYGWETAPDVVLVSHAHRDHLDLPSLDRVGRSARIVAPRGCGALLRRRGFADVAEVESGDELDVGGVRVRVTHAEHAPGRDWGSSGPRAVGYVVAGTRSVYFAGDTDLFDGMEGLAEALDVALLPVGGWGPRLPAGHLDPDGAARALLLLRPRIAVPIHWGTLRPFYRTRPYPGPPPGKAFAERAGEVAPEVDVRVLHPGEALVF
jgi:L-ascorbate metabolism protein UlaG (beta-lactamase superfamily)